MSVLIVVESCFGNTLTVARAIGRGLAHAGDVTVATCDEAPSSIPPGVRLLLAGAPTHNGHAPNASSRAQAAQKGGGPVGPGLAEWIAAAEARPDVRVLTFDTVVAGRFSGSAAKASAKLLQRRGFRTATVGKSFVVAGTPGPLRDGEEALAEQWGVELAASLV